METLLSFLPILKRILPDAELKALLYRAFQWLEEYVVETENTVDDKIVIPILKAAWYAIDTLGDLQLSLAYLGQVLALFSKELAQDFGKMIFDFLKEEILESKSKLDDWLFLPIIAGLEALIGVDTEQEAAPEP